MYESAGLAWGDLPWRCYRNFEFHRCFVGCQARFTIAPVAALRFLMDLRVGFRFRSPRTALAKVVPLVLFALVIGVGMAFTAAFRGPTPEAPVKPREGRKNRRVAFESPRYMWSAGRSDRLVGDWRMSFEGPATRNDADLQRNRGDRTQSSGPERSSQARLVGWTPASPAAGATRSKGQKSVLTRTSPAPTGHRRDP